MSFIDRHRHAKKLEQQCNELALGLTWALGVIVECKRLYANETGLLAKELEAKQAQLAVVEQTLERETSKYAGTGIEQLEMFLKPPEDEQ